MEREWKRGDVFYGNFEISNNEHLQNKMRPWLIVQNDIGNKYSPTVIVVPLTTNLKKMNLPTHCIVETEHVKLSCVMCEQIRTVDKSDDWSYLDTLPPWSMQRIDEALKAAIGVL